MPRTMTVLRVFVASPNDVADERAHLEEVIRELNITWSTQFGMILELVKWETHSYPGVGVDAQDVINEQIGDDYDIFIGILWTRFGTPTERAESGTSEEFERAYARYLENPDQIRIMFYFKDAPIPPSKLDPNQLASIQAFRDQLGERGTLYWLFTDREEFARFIRIHLSRQVQEWQKSWGTGKSAPTISTTDAALSIDEAQAANIEEEEGIIELSERAQEHSETLAEVVSHILDAIRTLGQKVSERNSELDAVNSSQTQPDLKSIKRIANRTAEDMEQFVTRMKTEMPILAASYSTAIDAITRVATLSLDFQPEDVESIQDTLDGVDELVTVISETRTSTVTFHDIIARVPRVTTALNRAKRQTVSVLKQLEQELTNSIDLALEARKALQSLVE